MVCGLKWLSSEVRIALIQLIIKSHWAMIREKFDNNIHMVRSYILWIEFFATIYRCSDYSGHGGQDAGFIILDGIRMLCEKMYTLILHFNFYTNIIFVFKFTKGILFFLDLNGETRGKNNAL